jgi:hypothetical protein
MTVEAEVWKTETNTKEGLWFWKEGRSVEEKMLVFNFRKVKTWSSLSWTNGFVMDKI